EPLKPRECIPVHPAKVVARRVGAVIRELHRAAGRQRPPRPRARPPRPPAGHHRQPVQSPNKGCIETQRLHAHSRIPRSLPTISTPVRSGAGVPVPASPATELTYRLVTLSRSPVDCL